MGNLHYSHNLRTNYIFSAAIFSNLLEPLLVKAQVLLLVWIKDPSLPPKTAFVKMCCFFKGRQPACSEQSWMYSDVTRNISLGSHAVKNTELTTSEIAYCEHQMLCSKKHLHFWRTAKSYHMDAGWCRISSNSGSLTECISLHVHVQTIHPLKVQFYRYLFKSKFHWVHWGLFFIKRA